MTDTVAARELTIRRVFDAPRELVFRAFTEPEQLTRWWGKRGWTAPIETITVDPRPGGAFRLVGVNDADGREMPTNAVFRDVVEPERLVLSEERSVTTITFTDLADGRTEVALHITTHASEEIRRSMEGGLNSALDRLAQTLEAR
jgi:uncharacterized protein YndB with AHSA1/START domain